MGHGVHTCHCRVPNTPLSDLLTQVQVGCLMMRQVVSINWRYIGDAIPAFVTVMFIPFSYSAAYGLIAGLMMYVALNGMAYLTELVSGGRIVPDDADSREYWSSKSSSPYTLSLMLNIHQSNHVDVSLGLSGLGTTSRTVSTAIAKTTAPPSEVVHLHGVMRGSVRKAQIGR